MLRCAKIDGAGREAETRGDDALFACAHPVDTQKSSRLDGVRTSGKDDALSRILMIKHQQGGFAGGLATRAPAIRLFTWQQPLSTADRCRTYRDVSHTGG